MPLSPNPNAAFDTIAWINEILANPVKSNDCYLSIKTHPNGILNALSKKSLYSEVIFLFMNLSSPGHISVSRIIGIIVGWLMLIFLYSAYADNTNRNYSIAMWFIYFIFLTWSIISLILIYRTLTGGNALSGPSNFQAEKYMPDYAGYTMNRKFGLVLLGIAVVTIITGTFLSLAIEGYSLSLSAYYYSSQIQYASVAMFIVLSHAGIIIYSLNKKKFNNMVGFGNTESPSAK